MSRVGDTLFFERPVFVETWGTAVGTKEGEGALQLMPGYGKPVDPIVRDQLYNGTWPMNLHPYPLDDTTFLVSRRNQGERNFSIYLIDRFDN